MTTKVLYEVLQHYPDNAPDAFGEYLHDTSRGQLAISDVILLRWLDGREAYPVRIEHIRGGVLHVIATADLDKTSSDGLDEATLQRIAQICRIDIQHLRKRRIHVEGNLVRRPALRVELSYPSGRAVAGTAYILIGTGNKLGLWAEVGTPVWSGEPHATAFDAGKLMSFVNIPDARVYVVLPHTESPWGVTIVREDVEHGARHMSLDDLLRRASALFDSLTPDEQTHLRHQQRISFVTGNVAIGHEPAMYETIAAAARRAAGPCPCMKCGGAL